MALVGDILLELRGRIPDAPPVLPPVQITATPMTLAGGSVGLGNFQVVGTLTNAWGETAISNEVPVTVSGSQNAIRVQYGIYPTGFSPRAYLGPGAPGSEQIFYPGAAGAATIDILSGASGLPGTPPVSNTAYLVDSDGSFLGAFSAYRLFNRAISEMVRICGGVVDVTGVQTTVNSSMYRLASPFFAFVNAWFDGYPMEVVKRDLMYLRNAAAGFSGILSYEQDGPQSVIQVWPQSNRTGGQSTLSAPMGLTDNSFAVNSAAGFLAIGLAQVDSEVMVYSNLSGNTFGGVLRGMGGTDIATHLSGAPVLELNLRMSGYRMVRTYKPGESTLTVQVPQAWEDPLVLHMLSQVRSMEQDEGSSKALLGDFVQMADKIGKASRLGKIKPRQINPWGQNVSDARNVNGIGFGWLIG